MLATENLDALESLLAWLAPGSPALGQLCGANNSTRPWPRRGDVPLRWLHIPKCGSTFASTYLRYICPSLHEAATLGAEIPASLRWTAAGHRRADAFDAHSLTVLLNATCGPGAAAPDPSSPGAPATAASAVARVPGGDEPVCFSRAEQRRTSPDGGATLGPRCRVDPAYQVHLEMTCRIRISPLHTTGMEPSRRPRVPGAAPHAPPRVQPARRAHRRARGLLPRALLAAALGVPLQPPCVRGGPLGRDHQQNYRGRYACRRGSDARS